MPRINIEDSLLDDPRMKRIIKEIGESVAIGDWYRIAKCAQIYWVRGELIPEKIWKMAELNDSFIEFDLVERQENGYYLRGSQEQFKWLVSSTENGKKGGRPRKINEFIKPIHNPFITHLKPIHNPPTPTPPLTLTLNTIGEEGRDSGTAATSVFLLSPQLKGILRDLLNYPEEIIHSVATDAWLKYSASPDPSKNWDRFVGAYFHNEKSRIRTMIEDLIYKKRLDQETTEINEKHKDRL